MRKMKKAVLFYCLLSKRFFKKLSFVLLLCAVPLVVLGFQGVASQDSGVLQILLYMEDPEDEAAGKIVEQLLQEESVIYYARAEKLEEAQEKLLSGEADVVVIFRSGFEENMKRSLSTLNEPEDDEEAEKPLVVLQREENVLMQLFGMKLFATLYPSLSYSVYEDFLLQDLGLEGRLSVEEIAEIYESSDDGGRLLRMDYQDAGAASAEEADRNYMTAPVRGLLSLLVILSGFAADMFFMQDERRGMLDASSLRERRGRVYGYQLAAMVPTAVAVLLALYLMGDMGSVGREVLLMALYLADCMVFCNLGRMLCGKAERLGACLPLLMMGLLLFSPIFLTLRRLREVQLLLPPFYYLSEVRAGGWTAAMLLYAGIGFAVNAILARFAEKRNV